MAASLTLSYTVNSQNIANNTSNVTVSVVIRWTNGSYNLASKSGSLTIDGTKYTFTSPFNTGRTTSGGTTLFKKTVDVSHTADGTKTLVCSASYTTGISSGTIAASFSEVLATIPRKSSLSASNGTLETAQTLTVTRQATSFTHTITYKCGTASGTVCEKSSNTSISWTPPLSLASQNTTGTSVSLTFTITTYSGSTNVGSNTKTITCAIPTSVVPTVKFSVEDQNGYQGTYGKYIQGLSNPKVTITATGAYGATIKSYKTTFDGKTFTTATFSAGAIAGSGTLTMKITVTDSRGRSTSYIGNVAVLAYKPPVISRLTVHRCNADGTPNDQGEYVKAVFSYEANDIGGKGSSLAKLEYKKVSESESTMVALPLDNQFSVTDYEHIFVADSGKSYNVVLYVSDDFYTIKRATTASTAFTLMHWNADGTGLGIGKISEESNLFDVGLPARFNSPVYGKVLGMDRLPAIPANSDFNDYMDPGCYAVQSNAIAETCSNIPIARAGRLEVWSATGEGVRIEQWSYLRQRFVPYNSANAVWERDITRSADNVWKYYDWWCSSLTPVASEKVYSKAAMTIALSATITMGTVNAYAQIPFNKVVCAINDRLTLASNSIRIGPNIEYVKVSGQALVGCGNTDGLRHVRIQKNSGGTITNISWITANGTASRQTIYPLTPVIVPVKEGDLINMVFYTGNANDSNSAGSVGNGWQTYLTVEEL